MADTIFQDPRFDALRNAIYHTSRGRFLDSLNRFMNFIVISLGAAAVGKVTMQFQWAAWIELGIVLVATIQLVFDFGGKACTHLFLQKRYYELLSEMEMVADPSADKERKKWSTKLLTVAGDEPLTLRALDAIAYNTALDSLTADPNVIKAHRLYVSWLHRRLRHVFAFHGTQFIPSSARRPLLRRVVDYFWGMTNGEKSQKE